MSLNTILVTGGAGFIGSHTVELLLNENKKIIALDNLQTGKIENIDLNNKRLDFILGDVTDYNTVVSLVEKCDAVIHLAALPFVQKTIENPLLSLKINLVGFINILQAIREIKKDIRLIYASSAAVYGDSDILPCNDSLPAVGKALSPYSLEKANNERYAGLYEKLFGIKSLGLRYFNVYGPKQDPDSPYSGVITRFIRQYKKNDPISVFGDGYHSRDFVYVKDVARANFLAMQSDYCGVINIATGTPSTLRNLIEIIEVAGNKPAKIEFYPSKIGDITHSYATIDKAKNYIDFVAKISFLEGIQSLF